MSESITLPVFAIDRHRLTTDGIGVTTLIGAYGCPLACKYCLNPHAWNPETLKKCKPMTAEELYRQVKIDHLYFLATGGGVTFGGGESLLHSNFISEFRKLCPPEWTIGAETSLNVPTQLFEKSLECIDDYIIDIKDMNPVIYESYTGKTNDLVLSNLRRLITEVSSEHIKIRIPLIPNYNSTTEQEASKNLLEKMGFTQFELFPYVIR